MAEQRRIKRLSRKPDRMVLPSSESSSSSSEVERPNKQRRLDGSTDVVKNALRYEESSDDGHSDSSNQAVDQSEDSDMSGNESDGSENRPIEVEDQLIEQIRAGVVEDSGMSGNESDGSDNHPVEAEDHLIEQIRAGDEPAFEEQQLSDGESFTSAEHRDDTSSLSGMSMDTSAQTSEQDSSAANDSEDLDGSESDIEREGDEIEGNKPLYDGAPITVHESLMAILSLSIAHSLTGSCLADILQIILLHCRAPNLCKATLYKFRNYFVQIGSHVLKFHYYCCGCFCSLPSKESVCEFCQGVNKISYFIEIPIINQLQSMFSRTGFYESLQYRFTRQKKIRNNIEDIYDGALYQQFFQEGQFLHNPNNVSFMWYSDGVAIFRGSSKFSIWPLYLVINELRYKDRVKKENMILAGLWFGPSQPDPNLFLTPFSHFFQDFSQNGHNFELPDGNLRNVKGMLMCGTCDYKAKSMFMRMKGHNGYYGCVRCKSRGVNIQLGPRSNVRVHPYDANIVDRTHNEMEFAVAQAQERGGSYFGVLGISILFYMVPDFIRSMAIDVMHAVFIGICKLLTQFWFDESFSQNEFSHRNVIQIVDGRLKNLRPPSFVQRRPRSLEHDLKHWKASEFKLWMMYYSIPVLKGILNEDYFQHYIKLVSGVYLLSQESISLQDIQTARGLLHTFVADFEQLYGIRYLGINVHQLLHLPDVVLDLGPCWVYSCFFLEGMNGYLAKLYHGTMHVGTQICNAAYTFMKLPNMIRDMNDGPSRLFCDRLNSVVACVKCTEVVPDIDNCFSVGSYQNLEIVSPDIEEVTRRYLNLDGDDNGRYHIFHRLRKKGIIYFSESYPRFNERLSTHALFTVNNEPKLCKINYFIRRSECRCEKVQCGCPCQFYVVGTLYSEEPWYVHDIPNVQLSYLAQVTESYEVVAFPISSLCRLCFFFSIDNEKYICKPINTLEVE